MFVTSKKFDRLLFQFKDSKLFFPFYGKVGYVSNILKF